MKKRNQNNRETGKRLKLEIGVSLALLYALTLALFFLPTPPSILAQYYDNTTVTTLLNISNAAPVVYDVIIFDNDTQAGGSNVLLNAGTIDIVYCNATINDSNGWQDVNFTNGTLFFNTNYTSNPDRNVKYVNSSCSVVQNNGFSNSALTTCSFAVYFFANNGSWNCTITAQDDGGVAQSADVGSLRYFAELYAIDLENDTIDYGTLNVTQVSALRSFNITNAGNMHLNISVEGYGSDQGDNLAMNCSQGTSIAVYEERYALFPSANWSVNMTNLTSTALVNGISGLTINQNEDDSGNSTNTTYWAIRAPIGVQSGACNGSIIFAGIAA